MGTDLSSFYMRLTAIDTMVRRSRFSLGHSLDGDFDSVPHSQLSALGASLVHRFEAV